MAEQNLLPVVVLVTPQIGENIGAAARSMLNFGLDDLRIVNPRDGWPNPRAVDMAKGAKEVIDNARIYTSLKDALHDIHYVYASTARTRDMVKPVYTPRRCAELLHEHRAAGKRSALLFGPERSGLENDDIALSNAIVSVPVSERYPSLNLAQAVAVLSYEWFSMASDRPAEHLDLGDSSIATRQEVAALFEHLETTLDAAKFFKTQEIRPKMMRNISNLFLRANLTDQDVRTLRGMLKSLERK